MRRVALSVVVALLLGSTLAAQGARTVQLPSAEPDAPAVRVEIGATTARVSRDGGETWTPLGTPDPRVMLLYEAFDPLVREPNVAVALRAPSASQLYIVQFASPSIEEYRAALRKLGVEIFQYIPWQAAIVRMTPAVANRVARERFVRWVGPFHLAYRLEPELIAELRSNNALPTRRYNVMQLDWTTDGHRRFLAALRAVGARVVNPHEGSILVDVMLTDAELRAVVARNDVLWIDRWTPIENDVDNARIQGGAKALEPMKTTRYTGKGIRGYNTEGIFANHPEFAAVSPYRNAPIRHRATTSSGHGTNVNGIMFSRGAQANARGLLPDAQCISSSSSVVGSSRDSVTKDAVDPTKNIKAMFMTASWGNTRTTLYTSISAQMDGILFRYDIAHTQSQSNAGATSQPRASRPQAWAKNMISVGGFEHKNNSSANDDRWNATGSTGWASDGRVKPDIAAYYDSVRTTSGSNAYTTSFGGTSAATPIVAGHVGLIQEMFTDGIFGNNLPKPATWQNRFDNRPHMTTTKALLVNTSYRYPMLTNNNQRYQVGYGMPQVKKLYDLRDNILVVNETEVLPQGRSRTWLVWVKPATPELAASMCYADPPAAANASVHRVNDLDLHMTAPDSTIYWGNRGLKTANYNTPGSTANRRDTLENVFVKNPPSGIWKVRVSTPTVVTDGHKETAAVDADFALVVSGIGASRDRSGATLDLTSQSSSDLKVALTNLPAGWTNGRILFSLATNRPLGFGWMFGIELDALAIVTSQLNVAPFFFTQSTSFPGTTYQFPSAVAQALRGVPVDAIAAIFTNGVVSGVSNAARVTVQ